MHSIYVWLVPALTALFLYGLGQGLVKKYIGDVSPARFCLFFIVARTLVGTGYFLTQDHPPPFQAAGQAFMACVVLVYLLDGVGWILYYKSILVGPITIVGTLSAAYPALTVVFAAAFLGEVLSLLQYLGVFLVLAGCMGMAYCPSDPNEARPQRGWIWMAATALVLWGGAQTLLKYAYGLPEANEANVMLYMNLGGWMTLGVYGFLRGRLPAQAGTIQERTREWAHSMLPMGMMAGGDAAVIVATRYGPVSIVTPMTAAYPVVTIAFARLVLREKVTHLQYASICATLAGMYLTIPELAERMATFLATFLVYFMDFGIGLVPTGIMMYLFKSLSRRWEQNEQSGNLWAAGASILVSLIPTDMSLEQRSIYWPGIGFWFLFFQLQLRQRSGESGDG